MFGQIEVKYETKGGRKRKLVFPREGEWWKLFDWENPETLGLLEFMSPKLRRRVEEWLRGRGLLKSGEVNEDEGGSPQA